MMIVYSLIQRFVNESRRNKQKKTISTIIYSGNYSIFGSAYGPSCVNESMLKVITISTVLNDYNNNHDP